MRKLHFTLTLNAFALFAIAQIPTSGLVSYWPFDGNANDYSGNNNHGIVNAAIPAPDRFGSLNKAYAFNGINSHIDVPHSATIDMSNNSDFSVAFWVKTNQENDNSIVLSKHIYGTWNGYLFMSESNNIGYCNSPGQFSFYVASGAQQDACANSPISNDNANWYFITGIHKSSINQTYIYVNGVLQSDIGQKSGATNNTQDLTFGAVYSGNNFINFFNGYLDGVRIYNRELNQTEIIALYNEANTTTEINEQLSAFETINTFPNPTNGSEINVNFFSNKSGKGKVTVIDSLGKNILEISQEIEIGQNLIELNLENLADGFYHISISDGTSNQNMKFVKN